MAKIIQILIFSLLLYTNLYSQDSINRFEVLVISEDFEDERTCEELMVRPNISFFICYSDKNIFSTEVSDTIKAVIEIELEFNNTDSLSFFKIIRIKKVTSEIIISKNEELFIEESIYKIFKKSKFYQTSIFNQEIKRFIFYIPITFIPR
jgi:hypothetical protein